MVFIIVKKVLFNKNDLIKGQIMMINWSKMAPGKSFSAHYHEDMDEVFIMIQGKAEIRIDE
jgi:mannose-6-phosphate isomerase-like protein (cupin superfamily)